MKYFYLYCSVVIPKSFCFNFSGAHEEGKHSHDDLKPGTNL